ncbi:hypothetical protein NDU88_000755 [Pleurodeles waltl]|uniref:Uncharacterized protein n=1 Tax=Pleurodeles waltl TaxID=8319 RepID=A0AAV7Q1Q3_PLEWA|nr:hypothetical protein NDU88_000755 [Pleurodeles waltl]
MKRDITGALGELAWYRLVLTKECTYDEACYNRSPGIAPMMKRDITGALGELAWYRLVLTKERTYDEACYNRSPG